MDLEKWYRRTYMQSRNRDTEIENKCMIPRGRDGMGWETGIDTYTLLILCIKYIANERVLYSTGNSTQYSVVT